MKYATFGGDRNFSANAPLRSGLFSLERNRQEGRKERRKINWYQTDRKDVRSYDMQFVYPICEPFRNGKPKIKQNLDFFSEKDIVIHPQIRAQDNFSE